MTRPNRQKPLSNQQQKETPIQLIPLPTQQPPSIMNSMKESMISGFGFGLGSSIANKVSDRIFSTATAPTSPTPAPAPSPKIDCCQIKTDMDTCLTTCDRDCSPITNFYYKNCTDFFDKNRDKIDST
jgi:hypothetical protein